jgi:hypothetical protein
MMLVLLVEELVKYAAQMGLGLMMYITRVIGIQNLYGGMHRQTMDSVIKQAYFHF